MTLLPLASEGFANGSKVTGHQRDPLCRVADGAGFPRKMRGCPTSCVIHPARRVLGLSDLLRQSAIRWSTDGGRRPWAVEGQRPGAPPHLARDAEPRQAATSCIGVASEVPARCGRKRSDVRMRTLVHTRPVRTPVQLAPGTFTGQDAANGGEVTGHHSAPRTLAPVGITCLLRREIATLSVPRPRPTPRARGHFTGPESPASVVRSLRIARLSAGSDVSAPGVPPMSSRCHAPGPAHLGAGALFRSDVVG